MEKEIDQLREEGRELTRREHEIKLVVERDEKEVEGVMMEDHHAEEDNGWIGGVGGYDGDNRDEATRDSASD
ncbi:hypothetical protein OFC46_26700, partial [Escherichia coli]|nr:hypothetical protein [Escherichia coli]